MDEENKNTEEEEITAFPFQGKVSFAKALGITFMLLGIIGVIGTMILYDDLPYIIQDELKGIYFAIGTGVLLGNLAVGSILITLDRIASAIEKQNDK